MNLKQDPLNLLTDVVSPAKKNCEIEFEVLLVVLEFRLLEIKIVLLRLLPWESRCGGRVWIEIF